MCTSVHAAFVGVCMCVHICKCETDFMYLYVGEIQDQEVCLYQKDNSFKPDTLN